MRVLGIDPGLTRCGWGVVDGRPGARPTALGVGVIRTSAELDLELRLLELHTGVTALLQMLEDEMRVAMTLTGVSTIQEIDRECLVF